jgi:hypothetical protein
MEFFKAIVPNKNKFLELQQREFIHYKDPLKIANGNEFILNLLAIFILKITIRLFSVLFIRSINLKY